MALLRLKNVFESGPVVTETMAPRIPGGLRPPMPSAPLPGPMARESQGLSFTGTLKLSMLLFAAIAAWNLTR